MSRNGLQVFALIACGVLTSAAHPRTALGEPGRLSVVLPTSASRFPPGDGADIANAQCLICHSTGMVLRQPTQTAAQWTATINKMRTVYGAPMPEAQIASLSTYLANLSPEAVLEEEQPALARDQPAAGGAAIFQLRCAPCHQAAGTGVPGAFPPLAGSHWVLGSKSTLVEIALKGIQGSLTVGDATYAGVMPSFAKELNDQEIAAVLSYIRGQWGNAADPIGAPLVKSLRAATPSPSSPWNGDEDLNKLPSRRP